MLTNKKKIVQRLEGYSTENYIGTMTLPDTKIKIL